MKRKSQLLVVAIAAVTNLVCADAQTGFTVNGRSVSASTYQAYKLMNLSILLMRENRTSEACQQLKRALMLDPTVPEARSMYGIALARLGKNDAAAEQMRMAIAGNANGADARAATLVNLAALYQGSGKTQEAVAVYKQVLDEFPHSKNAHAIKERMHLFQKELARQNKASANQQDELMDGTTYFGNVIGQGRKRWPEDAMPIRVYVYPAEGLTGYNLRYDSILRSSFDEWQEASNGKMRFAFVDSPRKADITCTWIADAKLLANSAEGGEASVQTLQQAVVKSDILLSLSDTGSAFPFTDNLVRTLCLHEIGHSLGLMGHSTNPNDVLYCSTPLVDQEQHLSARDKATLNKLYAENVDVLSQALAKLQRDSNGNAENILRLATIAFFAVICSIIAFIAVIQRVNKKPRKRKRTS